MTSQSPLISVIIPVFNRSWQLKRALDSLRHQSFAGYEIIVCDDGSTEDIAGVVKDFEGLINIHLLQMPNWGGPAKPRNAGLKRARGKWVAYLDSDDWWDANRLEVVASHLNDQVDVLYHPLRVAKESGSTKSREKRAVIGDPIAGDPFKQMMLLGNPIPTSAIVVRKDLLLAHHGMSEERDLIALEDFDCWLRLASTGAHFYFLDQCLGSYWIGSDAISAISERQIEGQKRLYLRNAPKTHSNFEKQALARQNYVLGSLYLKLDKPQLAFEYLKVASPLSSLKLRVKRAVLMIWSMLKMLRNTANLSRTGDR